MAAPGVPDAVKERAVFGDLYKCAAEFAVFVCFDRSAEMIDNGLLAITDAQDRHGRVEHLRGCLRACTFMDTCRSAGQDNRLRLDAGDGLGAVLKRDDFAVDAGFAHPAGDQLGDLRPEVDDEHRVMGYRAGGLRIFVGRHPPLLGNRRTNFNAGGSGGHNSFVPASGYASGYASGGNQDWFSFSSWRARIES